MSRTGLDSRTLRNSYWLVRLPETLPTNKNFSMSYYPTLIPSTKDKLILDKFLLKYPKKEKIQHNLRLLLKYLNNNSSIYIYSK